jgi:hypothetical protein
MLSKITALLAAALAVPALAQSGGQPDPYAPPPDQASAYGQPPPSGTGYGGAQQAQPMPGQAQQPQQPQGGATGGGSQQVVVNPPPQQQPAPPPPSSTAVTVNPPAASGATYREPAPVVVERERERPSALKTVAVNAGYGAVAGALVGAGVALLEQGDNWGRDLMIGTGAGIIVGAVVGGVQAASRGEDRRVAMDGLGTPQRDRALARAAPAVVGWAGNF